MCILVSHYLCFLTRMPTMADNLERAAKNRVEIANIQLKYLSGEISREEAKRQAQPILNRINARAAEIAKKHGKRPYKLTFSEAMRNSY